MGDKKKENKPTFSLLAYSTAFSYPVLNDGKKDYKDGCSLGFSVTPETVGNDIVFHVSYELSSKDLQQYIDKGLVSAAVTIECDMTSYRDLYPFSSSATSGDITISGNDLFADVKAKCILLANREIKDFSCPNDWNDETVRSGSSFSVEKASILGTSHEFTFRVDEKESSTDLISSIAVIATDCNDKNMQDVSFDSQEIKIYFGKDVLVHYNKLGYLMPDVSLSFYIVPIFTEALTLLRDKEKYEEYSNYRWAEVLLDKIREIYGKDLQDLDISSSAIINAVFSNIALRSTKAILNDEQEQYED